LMLLGVDGAQVLELPPFKQCRFLRLSIEARWVRL
jgi:hypothetical protein